MARQQQAEVQNKFVRGLITEATGLTFPKDACTETWDCVFSETGVVSRRLGFDIEPNSVDFSTPDAANAAWSEYVWKSVGGVGSLSFLVIQDGASLFFYDISSSNETVSDNKKDFSVDLSLFIPSGSSLDPKEYRCSYAQGDGRLVVVNYASEPIVVSYIEDTDSITAETISIKYRDFVGLDDGLSLTSRPNSSVASLITSNPKHYYNILNQGWHATDALTQWDTARTDLPSNADQVLLYRSSATDAFDAALITSKSAGNTEAPKGHFILNAFAPNRTTAMTLEGFTGASVGTGEVDVSYSGSSNIGDFTSLSNAFDSNSGTSASATAAQYIGKTLGSASSVSSVRLSGVNNTGSGSCAVLLYGRNGAPPSGMLDGTYLGAANIATGSSASVDIYSSDTTTTWDHIWIRSASVTGTLSISEITIRRIDTNSTEEPITYTRPTTAAFFAGRAWYAGCDGLGLGNSVFFSQVIQRKDQYGKCYQANDPTSEDFPELLPDDGGVLKIPGAATIVHIGAYGNGLLVFATNGVWVITGSQRGYFTASNYGVRNISGVGTPSGASFVDYRGLPVWWGEAGIYTIRYDPNYDAYSVESLSDETIYSFIASIPNYNRTFVKGAYNPSTETITWVYNSASSLADDDRFRYDRVLVLNALSKAFYPQTISTSASVPSVRGVVAVKPASEAGNTILKFVTSFTSDGNDNIQFAEQRDGNYEDWASYGGVDYTSYFITGYMLEQTIQRNRQSNYVFVFSNAQEDSSVYMNSIYDWGSSGDSGEWGVSQQAYNSATTNRSVRVKRLKVRGSGKSLQLKFSSESGSPFNIIGWSTWNSLNASV